MTYLQNRDVFEMHKHLNLPYKVYIIDNSSVHSVEIRGDLYVLSVYSHEINKTVDGQIEIIVHQIFHSSHHELAQYCHIFIGSHATDNIHDIYTFFVRKHIPEAVCIWHDFYKKDCNPSNFQHTSRTRCVLNIPGYRMNILVIGHIT